jgi:hypothetical protein
MRRISIVFAFLLLLLPGITAFAQDENIDTLKFEDIHEEKPPYFVVGGGFIGTFFFPKFDDINAQLINLGSNFKSPLFLAGGEGIVPTFILKNVRFGIWGMGGSKLIEKDTLISAANNKRGMNYSLGLTGISIDYGYVLLNPLQFYPA